jgi:hypothetical protein
MILGYAYFLPHLVQRESPSTKDKFFVMPEVAISPPHRLLGIMKYLGHSLIDARSVSVVTALPEKFP